MRNQIKGLLDSLPTHVDAPCHRNRNSRERGPPIPIERLKLTKLPLRVTHHS